MPRENARQGGDGAREAGTASARDALEHPHMLFRFQKDPLDAAMQRDLAQAGTKSAAKQPPKRRAQR